MNAATGGALTVTSHSVLVEGDMSSITDLFNLRAGKTEGAQIPEDQMILGSVCLKAIAVFGQDGSHGVSVDADLLGVCLECRVGGLLECDCNTRNGL